MRGIFAASQVQKHGLQIVCALIVGVLVGKDGQCSQ